MAKVSQHGPEETREMGKKKWKKKAEILFQHFIAHTFVGVLSENPIDTRY